MRRSAGSIVGLSLMAGLLMLGSGHHKPDHPIPPGHQTTTTESTTTTVATTTTTQATTTTTQATTTTTQATTTTTVPNLSLTEDLVITTDQTLTGHIEGNGFSILIDGADVTMTDLTINNVGRVMWHGACGVATLNNVTVTNSGVEAQTDFYPLHWHLCGESTRGTILDNVTIQDSKFRGFVPHGSHGISILNSTCENVIKTCVWWNPPWTTDDYPTEPSIDNTNDLAIDQLTVQGWTPPSVQVPGQNAAVMLGAGSGNSIRNSTVYGPSYGQCSAYHWPSKANQMENVWVFENNRAENLGKACDGIFVWQNDPKVHVVDGFVGVEDTSSKYRNGGIDHGAYNNIYEYHNVDVPYLFAHALGFSVSDSSVGDAVMEKHVVEDSSIVFTNVTFNSFTIDNASNNGTVAATYYIDQSNLTCADILYEAVVPGTQVFIDGSECA